MGRSLVTLKPDCLERNLEKVILEIILKNGFLILSQKRLVLTEKEVSIVWNPCVSKKFYPKMVKYLTRNESIILVVENIRAIEKMNFLVGHYDSKNAEKNTIRYNFGTNIMENVIHSSLNEKEYFKEINLFSNVLF